MRQANRMAKLLNRGSFRDRAVLVTGASSGIGCDIARTLASRGAKVGLLARRKARLQELADSIAAAGGKALPLPCDVTERSQVRQAFEQAAGTFGKIDILINSAGILLPDRVEEMRLKDLERMIAVNLYGTVNTSQAVLPMMRAAGAGHIVNIASLAGRRGFSPLGGYCASKFAVVGFTEALRVELVGSGISASLVMPGVIDTPMVDEARTSGELRAFSRAMSMPPSWVTWAVIAAVTLGLTEVDVPLGSVIMEKLASFFPGVTDAMLNLGSRMVLGGASKREESQDSAEGCGSKATGRPDLHRCGR